MTILFIEKTHKIPSFLFKETLLILPQNKCFSKYVNTLCFLNISV